jgi:FtsZ-binding cell division protein ZapB
LSQSQQKSTNLSSKINELTKTISVLQSEINRLKQDTQYRQFPINQSKQERHSFRKTNSMMTPLMKIQLNDDNDNFHVSGFRCSCCLVFIIAVIALLLFFSIGFAFGWVQTNK